MTLLAGMEAGNWERGKFSNRHLKSVKCQGFSGQFLTAHRGSLAKPAELGLEMARAGEHDHKALCMSEIILVLNSQHVSRIGIIPL